MKKFLIFTYKDACYHSYIYFAERMADEFHKLGYEAEIFIRTDRNGDELERYRGQTYTACMEFNSSLPKALLEDGTYYLDQIDAPFYDFILDHPLYHHDALKQKLKNFHVFCLDEKHRQYIKRYYPHIRSVHVFCMTGEEYIPATSLKDRSIDVLFTGTYMNPKDIQAAIDKAPLPIQEDINGLIKKMLTNTEMTQEEVLLRQMKGSDIINSHNFSLFMKNYFLADTYIRAFFREKVIKTLAGAGIPLTLYGSGWDTLFTDNKKNLQIEAGVPFKDTFYLMSRAKIVLNIMPWFKAGTHDRIFSAMLNHCISLTDTSSEIDNLFEDGKNIVLFDLNHLEKLPELVGDLLGNADKMQAISEAGYREAVQNHTWDKRVKEIAEVMKTRTFYENFINSR